MSGLDWTESELDACVRAYLWMRRATADGFTPVKAKVRIALMEGPLAERSKGSLEFRFRNISAVLDDMGEEWLQGYIPAGNVGANGAFIEACIRRYDQSATARRMPFMVKGLPQSVIRQAADELLGGAVFAYPDSRTYDVVVDSEHRLPPKQLIGYAGLLHYGAPLYSDTFTGGLGTDCFKVAIDAGFNIKTKVDGFYVGDEPEEFRQEVIRAASSGLDAPPGERKPRTREVTTKAYERDVLVVAYVESRAAGICELCGAKAPFERPDGTPFLEVHHIIPLSEGGEDTVHNAAALCPNCHRECHHGARAQELRLVLLDKIAR